MEHAFDAKMDQQEYFLKNIFFICGLIEENNGQLFIGGCGKDVSAWDSYRCADCTAMFHRECIRKHFKKHESQDSSSQTEELQSETP